MMEKIKISRIFAEKSPVCFTIYRKESTNSVKRGGGGCVAINSTLYC